MAESKFKPQTVTTRKTTLCAPGSHEASTINYSVTDYTQWGPLDSVSYIIDPSGLDPRLATKDCMVSLVKKLNQSYKPKHPEFYNDLNSGEPRFCQRTDHPNTPFASNCRPRKLDRFQELKHDAVFVALLCERLDEEAMHVIEAIKTLMA